MKVVALDLDFTLWNAGDTWCSETNPPYSWKEEKLMDSSGRWIRLYPETKAILELLKKKDKIIAIASRTFQPDWAMQLLHLFDIEKYIDIKEIYPGSKVTHLTNILDKTGCHPHQVIFFDDEKRNIEEVESMGVSSILVDDGINLDLIKEALS